MSESLAEVVVATAAVYCAIGLAFGLAFVALGAGRIDPAARAAPLGFRVLILPGSAALWPFLASRWLRGRRQPPEESNAHRRAAARGGAA